MNVKSMRRAERRDRLVAQAASQRLLLAENVGPWRKPLALADRVLAAARFVGQHPAWLVGAAIVLMARPPGRTARWLRRGWVAWRVVHDLRSG